MTLDEVPLEVELRLLLRELSSHYTYITSPDNNIVVADSVKIFGDRGERVLKILDKNEI